MIRAKKSLGQHFLVDKNIARKIVKAADPGAGDIVVEIGAGTGVLTGLLAESGVSVHAVDIDRRAIEYLESLKREAGWKNVEIHYGDILELDLASLSGGGTVKVIGNLPYNITSPILFRLFAQHSTVESAVCMMQYEVAKRICSAHGNKDYGILSVISRAYSEPRLLFKVSPNVFAPRPEVWSAVVRFDFTKNRLHEIGSTGYFVRTVKAAFGVRRKTLKNALQRAGMLPDLIPEGLEPYLHKRAEQLSIDEFIDLTTKLGRHER